MRWPVNKEQSDYMKIRQAQNRAKMTRAETWAFGILKEKSPIKWTFQALWGCRIYDFWNGEKRCAIEIDGPEHDREYDAYRDKYNLIRSEIIVFRVNNFDEAALLDVIKKSTDLPLWKDRCKTTPTQRRAALKAAGMKKANGDWRPKIIG